MGENRAKLLESECDKLGFRTGLGLTRREMAQLGALGVFKESCRLCCGSRLLSIQFAVVVLFNLDTFSGTFLSSTATDPAVDMSWWSRILLQVISDLIILFCLTLPAEAAVLSAVGSIYLCKTVTLAQVLKTVPRLWIRLLVTALLSTLFLFVAGALIALPVICLVFLVKYPSVLGFFLSVVIVVASILFLMVIVLFRVTIPVTCYDELYGWAAFKRSRKLLEKKWESGLLFMLGSISIATFASIWNSLAVPDANEWSFKWFSVVLLAVHILVRSYLFHIVIAGWAIFYFACKEKQSQEQHETHRAAYSFSEQEACP